MNEREPLGRVGEELFEHDNPGLMLFDDSRRVPRVPVGDRDEVEGRDLFAPLGHQMLGCDEHGGRCLGRF